MKFLRIVLPSLVILTVFPRSSYAWNIPGHMLSGAIAYQIIQRENPSTIPTVRSALEGNPWYDTHWKPQLEKLPDTERDEMLFMLVARWADDISHAGQSREPSAVALRRLPIQARRRASEYPGNPAAARKHPHSYSGEHADSTNRE